MKYLYAIGACIFMVGVLSAQTSWQVLNPKPSYRTAIAAHFVTPEHGYIVNESQILETVDSGNTWTVKQNISTARGMSFKNNTGVIAGYYGYAIRSIDAGTSWQSLNTGSTMAYNSVCVVDNNTYVLSGESAISITTDGGLTWATRNITNAVGIAKTIFLNATTGLAFGQGGRIVKTTDGGLTWMLKLSSNLIPSEFLTAYFVNENLGFASRAHSDVLRTTDGGETWAVVDQSSQAIFTFFFLDSNVGYGCGDLGLVTKTTDGGNTWNNVPFQNGYIGNTSMYAMYFTDQNNGIVAGHRGMIEKTTNGGASWTAYAPTYNDISKLAFPTPSTGYALVGNTFFKSQDFGENWVNIGAPQTEAATTSFDFVTPDIAYAIGGGSVLGSSDRRTIYKTTNACATWTVMPLVSPIWHDSFYSIDFIDENTGVISGGFNQPATWRTTNGGQNWQQVNNLAFNKVKFVTDQVGYARRSNKIYKSTDAGQVWTEVFDGGQEMNDFSFSDANNGYFGGDNGAMFRTTNGGLTWEIVTMPYGHYEKVWMHSPNLVYAQDTYNGVLVRSTNQGATWPVQINIYMINSLLFSSNKVYIAGTSGKILKANSGVLENEDFVRSDHGIRLYPNPTDAQVTVQTDGPPINQATVYDMAGRLVLQQSPHQSEATLDLSGFAKGMYLVKVDVGQRIITQKVLLE